MTISQPNPDVNPTGAEVEEFIDDAEPAPPPPPSPTPHPGEPDRRPRDVVREPDEDTVQEGIASPKIGS